MIIQLVRHGTTFANERRLYCGLTDSFVSSRGLSEIGAIKQSGKYKSAKLNFTSPLVRTHQTFKEIFGHTDFIQVKEFSEFDFGHLEMKTDGEATKIVGYEDWVNPGNIGATCPGGENNIDFNRRVMAKFREIVSAAVASNSDTCIVCHGGVISTIMFTLFENERDHFYRWLPKGGEGYTLVYDENGILVSYLEI